MSPSQPEFLRHILDECDFILQTTLNKTEQEIINDPTLSRAIIRSFQVIGEATKNLNDEIIVKYPQIDWKEIAGMRDKIIHDYFGIDYDIIYNTVKNDIPALHHEIRRIIEIESPK